MLNAGCGLDLKRINLRKRIPAGTVNRAGRPENRRLCGSRGGAFVRQAVEDVLLIRPIGISVPGVTVKDCILGRLLKRNQNASVSGIIGEEKVSPSLPVRTRHQAVIQDRNTTAVGIVNLSEVSLEGCVPRQGLG